MRLHAVIIAGIFAIQSQAAFSLINYWPGWYFAPMPSNTFAFPYRGGSFPAFALQTNSTPQNISSGSISATFRVTSTPDAVFRFGGQDNWNTGTLPPHARLFFSSYHGYLAESGCPECFWWSRDGWVAITNGTFTISATLDPARWTHAHGQTNAAEFYETLANTIEVGIALGGGSFFDIGVGMTAGNATLEMLALDFIPAGTIPLALPFALNKIETSTDLTSWTAYAMRAGPGVMLLPIGEDSRRFWRAIQ